VSEKETALQSGTCYVRMSDILQLTFYRNCTRISYIFEWVQHNWH